MDKLVDANVTLKTPAFAAQSAKSPLAPHSIERRKPRAHDVLIDILSLLRRLPFRRPSGP
jgi:hypothetical protein